VRVAVTILAVATGVILLAMAGVLIAVRAGWLADDDSPPIGVSIGIVAVLFAVPITSLVLAFRGRRLIKRNVGPVAAAEPDDVRTR
jgi:hypothetical protein